MGGGGGVIKGHYVLPAMLKGSKHTRTDQPFLIQFNELTNSILTANSYNVSEPDIC
jgi:hypothetical protein